MVEEPGMVCVTEVARSYMESGAGVTVSDHLRGILQSMSDQRFLDVVLHDLLKLTTHLNVVLGNIYIVRLGLRCQTYIRYSVDERCSLCYSLCHS